MPAVGNAPSQSVQFRVQESLRQAVLRIYGSIGTDAALVTPYLIRALTEHLPLHGELEAVVGCAILQESVHQAEVNFATGLQISHELKSYAENKGLTDTQQAQQANPCCAWSSPFIVNDVFFIDVIQEQ